ncbi:MAG: hypothetical protein H6818_07575 [Phycisphaerales bacterium]|nr:hypothetical protein [Phycisphaerales bacterium]MCB9864184.1 hypothetical protein [Phycisphaerales bacterium]
MLIASIAGIAILLLLPARIATPQDIRDSLRHPLVVAWCGILLSSGLFGHFVAWRDRKNKRRDLALVFLESIANPLNVALTNAYRTIRTGDRAAFVELKNALKQLYFQRMRVLVQSHALLRSPSFGKEFDEILHQLDRLALSMECPAPEARRRWERNTKWISEEWKTIRRHEFDNRLDSPHRELMQWLKMIWERTAELLLEHTDGLLEGGGNLAHSATPGHPD